jgi:hypothetical protein
MKAFEVKEERVFVQAALKEYVDISEVATGEIQKFRREIVVQGDRIVDKDENIIESYSITNGLLKRYFHVDNDYWNTILPRSGHREEDWIEVNP